jgi:hypothetical protein
VGSLGGHRDLVHANNSVEFTRFLLSGVMNTGATWNHYLIGSAVIWSPVAWLGSPLLTAGLEPSPRFHPRLLGLISVLVLFGGVLAVRLLMACAARVGCSLASSGLAAGVIFLGSPLVLYTTRWQMMTHLLSAGLVAAHLWAMLRWRADRDGRWTFAAGALGGLMCLVRHQNALYLTVACSLFLEARRRGERRLLPQIGLLVVPVALCLVLQMEVWSILFGTPLLVPEGKAYLHWSEPAILSVLFSGFHGLLTSHPTIAVALIGLALLCRRDAWIAAPLLVTFALQVYLNSVVQDWWGSDAFGARRFTSFAAAAAIGLAVLLDRIPRPVLRGSLVALLLLLSLIYIRLWDDGAEDLTRVFLNRPAHGPRLEEAPLRAGVPDPRESAARLLTDPFDELFEIQVFKRIEHRGWPHPPGAPWVTGWILLGAVGAAGWGLSRGLRPGGPLRRRRLVVIAASGALLWVLFLEARIALDDHRWRDRAMDWQQAVLASDAREYERAETALRAFPREDPHWAPAQFILAHNFAEEGKPDEARQVLVEMLGVESSHLYPPAAALLRQLNESHVTPPARTEREEPSVFLGTAGSTFALWDKIASTTVYHWYDGSSGHQASGPWRPIEGFEAWTGEVDWWKGQIKQMMMANFDLLYVLLIDFFEEKRVNLFRALAELRAEGWDVPRVAPFLDPPVTWAGDPMIDLTTEEGLDTFVGQYIRFYEQFFSVNTDEYADTYIGVIDDRVALNVWHMHLNCLGIHEFTREDVESRLAAALGAEHPVFNNGVYLTTTALSLRLPKWLDEKIAMFEIVEHFRFIDHLGMVTFKICPGNWDQNVRTPGNFIPRDGGAKYREYWPHLHANPVHRVFIESWNEYDEGTGIYAADPGPPFIRPGSENPSTDVWSESGDPFEYIEQTAKNLARFNPRPDLDSRVLWHSLPPEMVAGEVVTAEVIMRNQGDRRWHPDEHRLTHLPGRGRSDLTVEVEPIDIIENEIDLYRGVFRGRPVTFRVAVTAPQRAQRHEIRLQMRSSDGDPFGEELRHRVRVTEGSD